MSKLRREHGIYPQLIEWVTNNSEEAKKPRRSSEWLEKWLWDGMEIPPHLKSSGMGQHLKMLARDYEFGEINLKIVVERRYDVQRGREVPYYSFHI